MTQFQFRLRTLQKLRALQRDELRMKLAEAIQAQQILEHQLAQVEAELADVQASRRGAVEKSMVDINELLAAQRYQAVLLAQHKTMADQARMLNAEADRRRQATVEANREVRILEKLRDQQKARFQERQRIKEAKQLDEIAARCGTEVSAWLQ